MAFFGSPCEAKPLDGLMLENASMLTRGVWNVGFGVDFGSGAEVVEGPFLTPASNDAVEDDHLKIPLEIRYGLTDRSEIGWSLGYESDNGKTFPAGSNAAGTYFNGSGLQNLRLFGKWKMRARAAWMFDVAFLGDNALADGNDGFDFGLKYMYSPKIGSGWMLLNLGVVIKSGGGDFNDNGVTNAAEDYRNPIQLGLGYVYPFTSHLSGIIEAVAATSRYEGGSGFKTNNSLDLVLGLRALFADRWYLTAGAGFGALSGSPGASFRIGLGWLMGNVARFAQAEKISDWWTPSEDLRQRVATGQTRDNRASGKSPTTVADRPATTSPSADPLAERLAMASDAFNRRDYVAATAHYEAAVLMSPTDPVLYYNLATAYFLLRRYRESIPVYQEAARLNPKDVDSHLYLGYTYFYLKDMSGAEREWKKVLELDPQNVTARENLAALGVQ